MKYTILMGSPRREGNTARLLDIFQEANRELGVEQEVIWLYDRDIKPCLGCKSCQDVTDRLGCVHEDDFQAIYDGVQSSDLLILATPIYAWFCTAPMKTTLDRLIYSSGKYYGKQRQRSTLAGKRVATLVTCGYPVSKGADLWEDGLKRLCRHVEMDYLGMYCRRDTGKPEEFMDEQGEQALRSFARDLYMTVGASR